MDEETTQTETASEAREPDAAEAKDATRTGAAVDDAFVTVPDAAIDASEPAGVGGDEAGDGQALLERDRAEAFRRRWEDIQAGFVDRPRESVEQADRLVLEAMQQLQASFTLARERLEAQWSEHSSASTEDLRQALQRYRSFFDRLLDT